MPPSAVRSGRRSVRTRSRNTATRRHRSEPRHRRTAASGRRTPVAPAWRRTSLRRTARSIRRPGSRLAKAPRARRRSRAPKAARGSGPVARHGRGRDDRGACRVQRAVGCDRRAGQGVLRELVGDGERETVGELREIGRVEMLAPEGGVGAVHVGVADLRAPARVERGAVDQRLHALPQRLRRTAVIQRLQHRARAIERHVDEQHRGGVGGLPERRAVLADGVGDRARPLRGADRGIEAVVLVVQPDDGGRRRALVGRQRCEVGVDGALLRPVGPRLARVQARRVQPRWESRGGLTARHKRRPVEGTRAVAAQQIDRVADPVEAEQVLHRRREVHRIEGREQVCRVGLALDQNVQLHTGLPVMRRAILRGRVALRFRSMLRGGSVPAMRSERLPAVLEVVS